jgi:hypothetical protein
MMIGPRCRLLGMNLSALAAAAIFWFSAVGFQEVGLREAYAQERAPLAKAAELVRRKGFKTNMTQLCKLTHFEPKCDAYDVATDADEKRAMGKVNYPTDLVASFYVFAEPPVGGHQPIIVANQPADYQGPAYAFLTDIDGQLKSAYIARIRNAPKGGHSFDWSPVETTPQLTDMFAKEVALWSSDDILKLLGQAPDRKD